MFYDLDFVKRSCAGRASIASPQLTRRTLLASTAFLALAATTTIGPAGSWAASGVSAEQRLTLIRMARDIYPHDDFLPDEPYVAAVDTILGDAAKNEATRKLVAGGLADLEGRSQSTYGAAYAAVADGYKREGLLRSIELTDFFQRFRGELLMGIYNNKSLWPKFGYDGSSWERGGFMDSFDKIDWL